MNINVDAVLAVSAMIFTACMGGLGTIWLLARRQDRVFQRDMDRRHR